MIKLANPLQNFTFHHESRPENISEYRWDAKNGFVKWGGW